MAQARNENLIRPGDAEKLISSHDGNMALLWLHICLEGSYDPESAAERLCLTRREIDSAEEKLRRLGFNLDAAKTENTGRSKAGTARPNFVPPADEAPEYTAAEIASRVAQSPEFTDIVKEATGIIGHSLSTPDLKKLYGIYDWLGLPTEVIMMLLNFCAEKSGSRRPPTMRYVEKQAILWVNKDIRSLEAAEEYIHKSNIMKEKRAQMKTALGIDLSTDSPSLSKRLDEWIEMGFDREAVAEAHDRTVLKLGKAAPAYTDGILRRWHSKGLIKLEDIIKADPPFSKSAKGCASPGQRAGRSGVSERKKIDMDELENILNNI